MEYIRFLCKRFPNEANTPDEGIDYRSYLFCSSGRRARSRLLPLCPCFNSLNVPACTHSSCSSPPYPDFSVPISIQDFLRRKTLDVSIITDNNLGGVRPAQERPLSSYPYGRDGRIRDHVDSVSGRSRSRHCCFKIFAYRRHSRSSIAALGSYF